MISFLRCNEKPLTRQGLFSCTTPGLIYGTQDEFMNNAFFWDKVAYVFFPLIAYFCIPNEMFAHT